MKTSSPRPTPKRDTISVSQLNRQAKRLLEGEFNSVWVAGELSNLAQPASGHWYFSLKDDSAQIRCAMFRGQNSRLRFNPEPGQQLNVRAKLSLYEPRGDYQLIVEHMEPAGVGALTLAFEQLKEKLQSEGLFADENKKPLPAMPKHLAVITSATGAALQDILTVLARRFPSLKVTVLPVAVQGNEAAAQIAAAIDKANNLVNSQQQDFELLIVGRGGGSLEDLWSFNEEIVARSIFNSALPVVSAVGHEVDFTIADFVADLRAPTPSAAAELVSPDSNELLSTLSGYRQLLAQQLRSRLAEHRQQLLWLQSQLQHPGSRLQEQSQKLDGLELKLQDAWQRQSQQRQHRLQLLGAKLNQQTPGHRLTEYRQQSDSLFIRLRQQLQHRLQQSQQRLQSRVHLLNTVSPLATLERGYAFVTDEEGKVLTDSEVLKDGQTVITRLAKGEFRSEVIKTGKP